MLKAEAADAFINAALALGGPALDELLALGHAVVLEYVARVFDDGQGCIMPSFLNLLPHDGRADGLRVAGASRRQALLFSVGTTEERTADKA